VAGDVLIAISVSGNSPNVVKALEWGRAHGLRTIALVGAKRGLAAELADQVVAVADTHYGRVEDVQMHISPHDVLRICRRIQRSSRTDFRRPSGLAWSADLLCHYR
jgi:hypothetical protein